MGADAVDGEEEARGRWRTTRTIVLDDAQNVLVWQAGFELSLADTVAEQTPAPKRGRRKVTCTSLRGARRVASSASPFLPFFAPVLFLSCSFQRGGAVGTFQHVSVSARATFVVGVGVGNGPSTTSHI